MRSQLDGDLFLRITNIADYMSMVNRVQTASDLYCATAAHEYLPSVFNLRRLAIQLE